MPRFVISDDDLKLFSAASLDRNPLHLSAEYARRTPFGKPIVHGVLNALSALAVLKDRPGYAPSKLSFVCYGPAFAGIEYTIEILQDSLERARIRINDGNRPIMELSCDFAPSGFSSDAAMEALPHGRSQPRETDPPQLTVGHSIAGQYASDAREVEKLSQRIGLPPVWRSFPYVPAALWISYLVGMELPGLRGLLTRSEMMFHGGEAVSLPFDFMASITGVAPNGELTVSGSLSCQGHIFADFRIGSQVLEPPLRVDLQKLRSLVGESDRLKGTVSLVTGGSRGLGSAIVGALALQGSTVFLNFEKCHSDADTIKQSLRGASGKVLLAEGDISDMRVCEQLCSRIRDEQGRLDFLVCNASPPVHPLWLEPCAAERMSEFINRTVMMNSAPMSVLLEMVAAANGWNVVVSCSHARTAPAHFPHVTAGKVAIEALAHTAAAEYKRANHMVLRPPKMLTSANNTPYGRKGMLAPECVAAKLMKRLLGAPSRGAVEVIDNFS